MTESGESRRAGGDRGRAGAAAARPRREPHDRALGPRVRPLAVAAAGGAAAGVAVIAIARAASRPARRPPRRGLFRRREKVVASRSFLVDVHVLGR